MVESKDQPKEELKFEGALPDWWKEEVHGKSGLDERQDERRSFKINQPIKGRALHELNRFAQRNGWPMDSLKIKFTLA